MALIGCAGRSADDSPDDTSDTSDTSDTGDTGDTGELGFSELEPGVWSLVPVQGMICADGSPTGVGVNPGTSNELVVVLFMQHACFLDTFCPPGWLDRLHNQGFDDGHMRSTAAALGRLALLDRADAASPLRDATWIYVPECTGDVYAGDNIASITGGEPDRVLSFHGDANVSAAIDLAASELPSPDRVWGVGVGMGGFGVQLQADRFATAWPQAERAFLADSAPMLTVDGNTARIMRSVWNVRVPDGCVGCDDLFTAALEHQIAAQPSARFGLVTFRDDPDVRNQVIRGSPGDFPARIAALVDSVYTTPQAAAFLVDAEGHVAMRNAPSAVATSGAELEPWLRAWATGGESFRTER